MLTQGRSQSLSRARAQRLGVPELRVEAADLGVVALKPVKGKLFLPIQNKQTYNLPLSRNPTLQATQNLNYSTHASSKTLNFSLCFGSPPPRVLLVHHVADLQVSVSTNITSWLFLSLLFHLLFQAAAETYSLSALGWFSFKR